MNTMGFSWLCFGLFSLQFCWYQPVEAQGGICNHKQFIAPGQVYHVRNPNYPNLYPAYSRCSWFAHTKEGATIQLDCRTVNLVKSFDGGCSDLLEVEADGIISRNCKPFKVSASNIRMNLVTTARQGGTFQCTFQGMEGIQREEQPNPLSDAGDGSCDCGWNKKASRIRIVGGEESEIHEFPSIAAFVDISSRSMWCGATIISPTAVLTAAHCTAGRSPSEYGLLVGEHDITKGSDSGHTALLQVKEFINHADYNPRTQANDVALGITAKPIPFSEYVGPACLPFNYETPTGKYLTVAGWGLDAFGGAISNVLKKVGLKIVPNEFCTKTYEEFNPEKQICTYARGKDACQHDSGGPLYDYNSANKQFLMAVVSYGKDCGRMDPAVNSRVKSYLDWIESQLPSNNPTSKSETHHAFQTIYHI